jgi:hypothetical protein
MQYDFWTKLYLIAGVIFMIGAFAVLPLTHNPWAAALTLAMGAYLNRMAMARHWKIQWWLATHPKT